MNSILNLPEIRAWDSRINLIRIPAQQDVPITDRVRQIVDSQPFRRLANISQLGLVSLVYPGATHTRLEHSLGVYRMALLFLRRLSADERFCGLVTPQGAERLIVAALVHDIGHYPYCHAIEDMNLSQVTRHEQLAAKWLCDSELAEILRRQWNIQPEQILELLSGRCQEPEQQVLQSILSGPIDIDKMDYLYRDSLHAGVPYGMHYDRERLIGSLCLNESETGIAITRKGCTAAELMVFARYVMFSEVYWHHAVRSGTAMLQRGFFDQLGQLDLVQLFSSDDRQFAQRLSQPRESEPHPTLEGLFGDRRRLFKRLGQYSIQDQPEIFRKLARRRYESLRQCAAALAERLSSVSGRAIPASHVLIDAPPVQLEVQFDVSVRSDRGGDYRDLSQVSPVVHTLAVQQFDDLVKRVRVFVHPESREWLPVDKDIDQLVLRAIEQVD